jgi:hypothetical protein
MKPHVQDFRSGRPWDQLAVSAVTRDRHWVTAIRELKATLAARQDESADSAQTS